MSTIGGSGNSSSASLSQLKDIFAQREREMDERHREEIHTIKTEHSAEIEKVRQEANDRLENQQAETTAKLNAKDLQNRKEVDAIRSMYQKRLAEAKAPKE